MLRHRPAESLALIQLWWPAVRLVSLGGTGDPDRRPLTTSRSMASGETQTEVAGLVTWRVPARPGGPAQARDRAVPRASPGPSHRLPGVRGRLARPHTAPSAGASDRSTSGSCPSRPARARRASPASLRSAAAARSEPPTARTVHQRGSRARRACRGAPTPHREGPGRVSRPPDVTVTFPPVRRLRGEQRAAGSTGPPSTPLSLRGARRAPPCHVRRAR